VSVLRLYDPAVDRFGPDGYPLEWHRTIKHMIRRQAGDRCVRCGHPYVKGTGTAEWSPCDEQCIHSGPIRWRVLYADEDHDWTECDSLHVERVGFPDGHIEVEARYRILTVHHLDEIKANCRWWNLAPLCQRCHLRVQGRVLMERVWPWEHTAWFRPYVAGFYAHTYLGQDLGREAVEARLDELLDLGRREASIERMAL
jgi:hypothetical protein